MKLNQLFSVLPSGKIKSGSFQYDADTDTGIINYSGDVVVGFLFISKTIPITPGSITVDPSLLVSANMKQGEVINFPPVSITATSITPNVSANVNISIQGQNISGTGIIDLSGQFIAIKKILASGKVSMFNINLDIEPVTT